jgi:hypothetical protein
MGAQQGGRQGHDREREHGLGRDARHTGDLRQTPRGGARRDFVSGRGGRGHLLIVASPNPRRSLAPIGDRRTSTKPGSPERDPGEREKRVTVGPTPHRGFAVGLEIKLNRCASCPIDLEVQFVVAGVGRHGDRLPTFTLPITAASSKLVVSRPTSGALAPPSGPDVNATALATEVWGAEAQ